MEFEAILRGVIFIARRGAGAWAQQESVCLLCANKHDGPRRSSHEIAWRELLGCRFLLSEVAFVLLLINPPWKPALNEARVAFVGPRCLRQRCFPFVSPDSPCFPGDSILSRNCFQSSAGARCGSGFVLWLLSRCQLMRKHKASSHGGEANRILCSLFICAAFHPVHHHFIPPAVEKDSVAERCLQGVVDTLMLRVNINICFDEPKCILNKAFPNDCSGAVRGALRNTN